MTISDRILIINTGGTIGMVNAEIGDPFSPLRPAATWEEIVRNYPVLRQEVLGINMSFHTFCPLLDSSNIDSDNWKQMALVIRDNYDDFNGFVILHGTDTMCYTASALSFMLEYLDKPVVITGSQVPLVKPRTDAVQNLVTSIQIAAATMFGYPVVPEVCIYFRDYLFRGNRSRKQSSSGYNAFSSPNFPHLAKAGERIVFNHKHIRQSPNPSDSFHISTNIDTHVMMLDLFPGIDPQIIRAMLINPTDGKAKVKALVLKTYGSGNAPNNLDFLSVIQEVSRAGTIVVDVTQCSEGMVQLGLYETSRELLNCGVISGFDLTPEAAVCKLMYLLGKYSCIDDVKREMQSSIRGEQSSDVINITLAGHIIIDNKYNTEIPIPANIIFQHLRTASIHINNITPLDAIDNHCPTSLHAYINQSPAGDGLKDADRQPTGAILRPMNDRADSLSFNITDVVKKSFQPGQIAYLTIASEGGQLHQCESLTVSFLIDVA